MLKSMRKNAKHVLWPLTIAVIIGMGGYGVWYLVQPEHPAQNLVGSIWGRKIYLEEFFRARHAAWVIASLANQAVDPQTLLSLTWQRILLQEPTEQVGISVDRRELAALLASIPLFQSDGRFNQRIYSRVLAQWQLGETEFEEMMENTIKIEKLKNTIRLSALTSPAQVDDFYQRANARFQVEYIEFEQDSFQAPAPISEDELRNFYEANRQEFQVPPQVDIQFTLIPFEDFEDEVTVTGEEIENYYQENRASFADGTGEPMELEEVRETIRAELVREGSIRAAGKLADKIDEALIEAIDLETIAEKYSLSFQKSGPFAANEPVPLLGDTSEVTRVAFQMEKDEISYPITLENGIMFFRLLDKSDEHLISFDQAREEVREMINQSLTAQEALKVAKDERTEIIKLMEEEGLSFADAAGRLELIVQSPPPFTPADPEEDIVSQQFIPAALLTPLGEVSGIFPLPSGFAFLTVVERKPAVPMPEEEKEEWELRARQFKIAHFYNDWFRELTLKSKLEVTSPQFKP